MATHPDPTFTRNIRDSFAKAMALRFERAMRAVEKIVRSFTNITASDVLDLTGQDISVEGLRVEIKNAIQLNLSGDPDLESLIEDNTKITVERAGNQSTRRFARAAGVSIAEANEILALFPQALSDEAQKNLVLEQMLLVTRLEDKMVERIMASISEGVSKGETIQQLTARVRDSTGMERARAETIARTETVRIFNEAAISRYTQHGVEMVEWITAGDEDVDENICQPLEGQRFLIGRQPPNPAHPRCRCSYLPVIVGGPSGSVKQPTLTPEIVAIIDSLSTTWDQVDVLVIDPPGQEA